MASALSSDRYQKKKAAAREISRQIAAAGQEIGPLPKVQNEERKDKCRRSFRIFCETYFSGVFTLEWSQDHLEVIDQIERTVLNGELMAVAMPRGSGKTSLCSIAVMWAALYGHRRFIALIAANKDKAESLVSNLMVFLETNPLLIADFPEVCYPVEKLERMTNRQKGQKYQGVPTRINWTTRRLSFPSVGAVTDGITIVPCGLAGADIRGLQYVSDKGEVVRPDLFLADDPQTRESAKSLTQTQDRLGLLQADVLKMAGPGKKIAGLCACTVIFPDDLADQILNREKNPVWRGTRKRLMKSMPSNMALWDKYAEIRAREMVNDLGRAESNAYYESNREEMDAGADPSWQDRYDEDEISAIQFAMDQKYIDPVSFAAEYQNEPLETDSSSESINPDDVIFRLNGVDRGTVPRGTQYVTGFCDIHKNLIYWMAVAWSDNFSGTIIDYGTSPDQKRWLFTLAEAQPTLLEVYGNGGIEGAISSGINDTLNRLFQGFTDEDGAPVQTDRVMIDANWGQTRDVVYSMCSRYARLNKVKVCPSHGVFRGASREPFANYSAKRGDWIGEGWRMPGETRSGCRYVVFDTNRWKSFVSARLSTPIGASGALDLFGSKPERHRLLAEHLSAETWVRVEAAGRAVDEWRALPTRDNHWLDCLVGCSVAASMCGAKLAGTPNVSEASNAVKQKQRTAKRISWREAVERKNGDRFRRR